MTARHDIKVPANWRGYKDASPIYGGYGFQTCKQMLWAKKPANSLRNVTTLTAAAAEQRMLAKGSSSTAAG